MPPQSEAADPEGPASANPSIEISALSINPAANSPQASAWQPRGSIGPYQLLNPIGSGGMGEVWLAEQTQPVRRRVALKLIKAGMDTGEVVARFQSERQALAQMDHPTIAKVFEAGSTPLGRPYFAMEYITGIPITDYCDQHRLTVPQRLELFIQVCDGVQHAHQKAIIHRDLKPSNILVSEVDGRPEPRIIDFGIAKAISQGAMGTSQFTQTGAIVGTPAYMSPEQAGSSGVNLDTRTDVYSLGVVLYELLAGERPLDFHDLAFDEMLRRLREDEAPRPSTRLRTLGDQSSSNAAERGTDAATLARQLRGDLDAITLKALEKDRSRRYGTPSELAADIRRYLNHEAVLAVPPSAVYRVGKFARRYRGALATAAAFVVVLLLAAGISIWQGIRATKQRDRADAEAAVAQAVNDFLQNDLLAQASAATQSGSKAKPDPHLEVHTALDRAAARIGGKFQRQPAVEAAIRDTIGQTYIDLGLYPEARSQLQQALELRRRTLGAESPLTLKTMSRLGSTVLLQGKYPDAEAILGNDVQLSRRVLGPEHPDTLTSTANLANVYYHQGKYPQAEALHTQVLEIRRRVLGPEHPDTLMSMNNLTDVYYAQGKYAQAESMDSQILEAKRRVQGPEHPDTLSSMNNLAIDYQYQGKFAQAEALHAQTLEIRRRVLTAQHPDTLASMNNLAGLYFMEGKFQQAVALDIEALEGKRRMLGDEHQDTLGTMANLAEVYTAQGKFAQAEMMFRKTLEVRRRVLSPEHPDTLASMHNLAALYGAEGQYAQAQALFSQTLQTKRRVLGPEHPDTLLTLCDFASMYQRQGKFAEAETYAAQTLTGRRHTLSSDNADTMVSAADLADVYISQRKFSASEPLAREALAFFQKDQPDDWQRFRSESLLGASLAGEKKYADAEPMLLEGYRGMLERKARIPVPDWYHVDRARECLVQSYVAWGKPDKAAEWKAAGKKD